MMEAEIWQALANYGALGLMTVYLMYDRTRVMTELITTLKEIRREQQEIRADLRDARKL